MYTDDNSSSIEPTIITMNYMDTVCNGSTKNHSSSSISRMSTNNRSEAASVDTMNMNWLISLLHARMEFAACRNIIERQLHNHPDKEYAFFVKGLIARKEGDAQESLQCLQQAINLNPVNASNYKEIGRTLQNLGRFRHALDAFRRAEALSSRPDAEVFHSIGELLMRKDELAANAGEQDDSRQLPAFAASNGVAASSATSNLEPIAAMMSPNVVEAKQYFIRAIHHDGRQQVDSFRRLSTIFVREADYPKAIEMLESIVQISPENVEVLTELGCLYLHVNDSKNAFDRLYQVTKLNQRYTKALLALGAILQSKNDVDGALNKYKLINVTVEDNCELWNNIGLCFLKKRKFVAAIACLKKSVWMSPLNFNCVFNLGLALLAAQQYASSYYAFSVAANIRPNNAESLMLIAICLRHLRDAGNAAVAFERATLLPEVLANPLIYLNFAVFCYEMGQLKAAHEAVANVLQMNEQMPLRKDYMKVLATLQQRLSLEYVRPEEQPRQPLANDHETPHDESIDRDDEQLV